MHLGLSTTLQNKCTRSEDRHANKQWQRTRAINAHTRKPGMENSQHAIWTAQTATWSLRIAQQILLACAIRYFDFVSAIAWSINW